MPRTVETNQNQFGFFGIAIALVTWLTGTAVIIVAGGVIAPVLAEDDGVIGRVIRGGDESRILAENAKPALPAPVRAPRLVQAIGIGGAHDPERDDETRTT
jgi:hypothetical protein